MTLVVGFLPGLQEHTKGSADSCFFLTVILYIPSLSSLQFQLFTSLCPLKNLSPSLGIFQECVSAPPHHLIQPFVTNQSFKLWTSLLLSSELCQWSSSGRKAKIFHRVYCPQSEPDFQQHAAHQLGAGHNKKAIYSFREEIRHRPFRRSVTLPHLPTPMHRHLHIPQHVSLLVCIAVQ